MNKGKKDKVTLHGKPGDVPEKLNSNSDSESYPSDVDYTHHLIKNHNFDDEMDSFDKNKVQFLQNLHFHVNLLKIVLCCIPGFDAKTAAMKTNFDDTPSNLKWDFSTSVTFKI